MEMTPKQAIEFVGSRGGLAALCNVSRAAIHLWEKHGAIPYDKQCQIEIDLKGALKANKRHAEKKAA